MKKGKVYIVNSCYDCPNVRTHQPYCNEIKDWIDIDYFPRKCPLKDVREEEIP